MQKFWTTLEITVLTFATCLLFLTASDAQARGGHCGGGHGGGGHCGHFGGGHGFRGGGHFSSFRSGGPAGRHWGRGCRRFSRRGYYGYGWGWNGGWGGGYGGNPYYYYGDYDADPYYYDTYYPPEPVNPDFDIYNRRQSMRLMETPLNDFIREYHSPTTPASIPSPVQNQKSTKKE